MIFRVRAACGGLWLLLLGISAGPCIADRLHLETGRSIDVARWWIEDDWLYYDGPAGTVGLPRTMVTRIDAGAAPEPNPRDGGPADVAPRFDASRRSTELRALLDESVEAMERGEYDDAAAGFRDLIDELPNLSTARVGYALSSIALGQDGLAVGVVLDGLVRDPDHPELHELLGDLRNREERVDDALREWKLAFELGPNDRLREKIFKAERELLAGGDLDFASTAHFNVRYDGDVDYALASSIMDYLEAQYSALAEEYRHAPRQPTTVQLLPTEEFREVTQVPEWVGGLYDGKIRVPLGGLARLDPRARAVLRHELTHAFIHSKSRGRCPRWLHEGLAQIAEGRRLNDAGRQGVRTLIAARPIENWHEEPFSYPAALSFTRYLVDRRGFDTVIWLLERLGDGEELDTLLDDLYGYDYAGLCRRWAEELGSEAR